MANRDKHKRRSGYSYSKNQYGFAGFARKVAIKNDQAKRTRSLREMFKNLLKRNKVDT